MDSVNAIFDSIAAGIKSAAVYFVNVVAALVSNTPLMLLSAFILLSTNKKIKIGKLLEYNAKK